MSDEQYIKLGAPLADAESFFRETFDTRPADYPQDDVLSGTTGGGYFDLSSDELGTYVVGFDLSVMFGVLCRRTDWDLVMEDESGEVLAARPQTSR